MYPRCFRSLAEFVHRRACDFAVASSSNGICSVLALVGLLSILTQSASSDAKDVSLLSKEACEEALRKAPEVEVIAMSILAAGYLGPSEAIDYITSLPELGGAVAGISNETQAGETFPTMRRRLPIPATDQRGRLRS